MAARLYENAERAGKAVSPSNIAYYAIQRVRSGRRAWGQSTTDLLHPGTQLCGRSRMEGFEDLVRTEEGSTDPLLLADVFSVHEEDPSMEAARNLDWKQFTATLNERFRAIVEVIAQGGCLKEVAARFKVSVSTIQNNKQQLAVRLREFFGVEILKEIGAIPQWRTNLLVHREMLACREEHQPV